MRTDPGNMKQLTEVLAEEVSLIDAFSETENEILGHITESSWQGLETSLSEADRLSVRIAEVEKQRALLVEELMSSYGLGSDTGFYRLTSKMDRKTGGKLNELYRELKISVLNLQNINRRIDVYVGTVSGIMRQALREIYPHRRGSLYSRNGSLKETGDNPMVLNRKL